MSDTVYCSGCYNRHDPWECPYKDIVRARRTYPYRPATPTVVPTTATVPCLDCGDHPSYARHPIIPPTTTN